MRADYGKKDKVPETTHACNKLLSLYSLRYTVIRSGRTEEDKRLQEKIRNMATAHKGADPEEIWLVRTLFPDVVER